MGRFECYPHTPVNRVLGEDHVVPFCYPRLCQLSSLGRKCQPNFRFCEDVSEKRNTPELAQLAEILHDKEVPPMALRAGIHTSILTNV